MAEFPRLKTDAVMQYPAGRGFQYATSVVRFVDGAEQRYREFGEPLVAWHIRLDLLDEAELAALENFFVSEQGRSGSFAFVDPWDNVEYPDCSLDQDDFVFDLADEMRAQTTLVVRQNRG